MKGLDVKLMVMLDYAREVAGIPFIITSGVRTVKENLCAKGVNNSAHLLGLACDIRARNDTEIYFIKKGAYRAGFRRIGRGNGHIHLDIDPDKPQNVDFVENY